MPKVFHYDTVKARDGGEGSSRVRVRWLLTKEMGAENFAMRLFEIGLDGYTPLHTHRWEHETFILEGEGSIFDGEKTTPFRAGDAVFVPPDERHQFKNTGTGPLKILCLIPYAQK
jgi:quercetin dioxygenase-like cupin family protein